MGPPHDLTLILLAHLVDYPIVEVRQRYRDMPLAVAQQAAAIWLEEHEGFVIQRMECRYGR